MEDVVKIVLIVLGSLFVGAVLANVVYVQVKRHGEKKQNDLHSDNQLQESRVPVIGPKDVNDFLVDIKIRDDEFQGRMKIIRREFEITKAANEPLGASLVDRLDRLVGDIYGRREVDKEWDQRLSDSERQYVAELHAGWEQIRGEIESITSWRPSAK